MKVIDTRGKQPYTPVIPAITALFKADKGETIEVILDNVTAFQDLKEYLSEHGIGFREIYDHERMILQFTK